MFVTKEIYIEVSGKCIQFVTVFVCANVPLSCANPSNVIGLLLLSVAERPLNFMEVNNWRMTLVEYK